MHFQYFLFNFNMSCGGLTNIYKKKKKHLDGPAVHGAINSSQKKALRLCGNATSSLSGFQVKGPDVMSVANDLGAIEMIPGAVHRSPGIYFTVEENPGKPKIGDHIMKAVLPFITLNGVPYLQMKSIGSHNTSWREMWRCPWSHGL